MKLQPSVKVWLISALACMPVLVHVYLVWHFAVDIPYYDDFLWSVTFVNDHLELNFWEKVEHIFSQHNQHRIAWLRLVQLSIIELFGWLNFKALVTSGIFGFVGLTILVARIIFNKGLPLWYILPIPFIFHDLSSYHNIFVSYGVPNMTVIFFALLSFYWLGSSKKGRFWLGVIFGVLATFTNGSGIFVMPIGLFGLAILNWGNFKKLGVYVLVMLSVIGFYFYNYQADYSELRISTKTLPYLIEFMASYVPFAKVGFMQAAMFLFVVVAIFITLKKNNYDRLQVFLIMSIAFLLASALAAALFRLIHDLPIPDWYYIYSYTFIALIYVWLLHNASSQLLRFGFGITFLVLNVVSYGYDLQYNLVKVKALQSQLYADAQNYINTHNWVNIPLKAGTAVVEEWQNNYDQLYQKGLVKLEGKPLSMPEQVEEIPCVEVEVLDYEYSVSLTCNEGFSDVEKQYLFAQNDEGIYFFGVYSFMNPLRTAFTTGNLFQGNGVGVMPRKTVQEYMPAGQYRLGFYSQSKQGEEQWLLSEEQVMVENY